MTTPLRSRDLDLEAIGDCDRVFTKAVSDGGVATLKRPHGRGHRITIQPSCKPIGGKVANEIANRQNLPLLRIKEDCKPAETVIEDNRACQRGVYIEAATIPAGGLETSTGSAAGGGLAAIVRSPFLPGCKEPGQVVKGRAAARWHGHAGQRMPP